MIVESACQLRLSSQDFDKQIVNDFIHQGFIDVIVE